jgi:hypothetical protein
MTIKSARSAAIKATLRERDKDFRQLKTKSTHEMGKHIQKVLEKKRTTPTAPKATWYTTITVWLAAVSPARSLLVTLSAATCEMTRITFNFIQSACSLLSALSAAAYEMMRITSNFTQSARSSGCLGRYRVRDDEDHHQPRSIRGCSYSGSSRATSGWCPKKASREGCCCS